MRRNGGVESFVCKESEYEKEKKRREKEKTLLSFSAWFSTEFGAV